MSQEKLFIEIQGSPKNTSIPLLTCDKVISDPWYAIRLTPFDAYTKKQLIEFLREICDGGQTYFLSQEVSKADKMHFHLVVACFNDPRQSLKEWLLKKYDSWGKADGNKRYNCKVVEDFDKAVKYLLKDGNYELGTDINPFFAEEMKKKSYKKFSKEAFAVEFDQLKQDYLEGVIDSRQLRTKIIQLKGLYRQPINLNRITEIVTGCIVHKDPSAAEEM